jgi:RNA polymerase sigma factor (sigma-70 family)
MSFDTAERYLPLARSLAWNAVRRYRQEYDEAYSDALHGLAKAIRRRRAGEPFGAYAYASIHGEILRGIRTRTRAARRNDGVSLDASFGDAHRPLSDVLAAPDPSPSVRTEFEELWLAVDRLPHRQRVATRLYYQCGFSQTEIAHLLGCSQMAVSRALDGARKTLAVQLDA